MFTLFHFGFELFKIALLSGVYSIFIYLSIRAIHREKLLSFIAKITYKDVYIALYWGLLIFSFTYYGNHGLGDEANIPLGHFQTMESGDGYAYFTPARSRNQISVDGFLVEHNKLCIASQNEYLIYDLVSNDLKKFPDDGAYNRYAVDNELPRTSQFKPFWPQYADYWNGWRFWMLP